MNIFGHPKPIYDPEIGARIGERASVVSRVTRGSLGGQFGSDRGKRLVVSMVDGDIISIRPERTQRSETILVADLYGYLLRLRAGRAQLERARDRKAKKAERRESQRISRADAKLKADLRAERMKGGD